MRILVFEYITGGGLLDKSLPQSLSAEGDLMLRSLVEDLILIPGIDVCTTRDARLPSLEFPIQEFRLRSGDYVDEIWQTSEVDAVWPIAPETDGILEKISRRVLDAGKILLNSPPSAVSIAASKKGTAERLSSCGISVVPVYSQFDVFPEWSGQWISKPDDGVGCEGIRILDNLAEALGQPPGCIFQPFLSGEDMSLSMICGHGSVQLLSVNHQDIVRTNDSLLLRKCVSNVFSKNREKFEKLAIKIAQAIPDLWGYVGVDLLVTDTDIKVLEINPRLTSSYAGLSATLSINPAEQVLKLLECNYARASVNEI